MMRGLVLWKWTIFGEAIALSLYGAPSPEISRSWVRRCMHKTIKIIVEATWGDRLPGWRLLPSARFEIVAGSEGGNSARGREMESRSYPITLKTIVLSARGGARSGPPPPPGLYH